MTEQGEHKVPWLVMAGVESEGTGADQQQCLCEDLLGADNAHQQVLHMPSLKNDQKQY